MDAKSDFLIIFSQSQGFSVCVGKIVNLKKDKYKQCLYYFTDFFTFSHCITLNLIRFLHPLG